MDGYLGCFHALVIVNSTVMNIGVHAAFELEFSSFLDICEGVGLLDHVVVLFLVFKGTSMLFSIVAALMYLPLVMSSSL